MLTNLHLGVRQRYTTWKGLLLAVLLITASRATKAQPSQQWDRTFGNKGHSYLMSMLATSDGGTLLGGHSYSVAFGDKTQNSKGGIDFWIVKLDANGNKQWDKTIGGSDDDLLTSLAVAPDGGYLLGGYSRSNIGGDKTENSRAKINWEEFYDYWVVKLDATGNIQWDKTFGGEDDDQLTSLVVTNDGGYLLGGKSSSGAGADKTQGNGGYYDYWLVKIDAAGTKQWDKTLGGNNADFLTSMVKTSNGGYVLGGYSGSGAGGDKTQASKGEYDYWVVKLDANGTKQWDKTLGTSGYDFLQAVTTSADGSMLVGGYTTAGISGDKTQANKTTEGSKRFNDYWVVKLDLNGNIVWEKTVGSTLDDKLSSLVATSDGGFLVGGSSTSGNKLDRTYPSRGQEDYWIVKLDGNGNKQWDLAAGGNLSDHLTAIVTSTDGELLLGGHSLSDAKGDKSEANKAPGFRNYWIVKLKECFVPNDPIVASSKKLTCSSPTATLAASGSGSGRSFSYQWNTGEITPTITVSKPGSYSVTVTDQNGCRVAANLTITSDQKKPSVGLVHDGNFTCNKSIVLLTTYPAGQQNYVFSSGAVQIGNGNTATVTQPGTYTVTVTAPSGCTNTATANVIVDPTKNPSAPKLTPSALTTINQPISVTATCSGKIDWNVQGGSGVAGNRMYTITEPGQYILSASCSVGECKSPVTSVALSIQTGPSPLKLVAPTYDCQTGAITFNTQGGNGSLIEYAAAGITRWSTSRSHTVEDGLRRDPKVILLQARQGGVVVDYSFDLPAACMGPVPANTPPQSPNPPIVIAPSVAQVAVPFSGTLVAFTDKETPNSLSYSLTGLPAGLSFNPSARVIKGTPTQVGAFVLTYQAQDAQGGINSINFVLTVNPPSTTPVTGNFEGYLDKVECGTIRGWVWDRDRPDTPLTVEFFTGDVVWGSAVANIYRADIKAAGKGNGEHVYHFTTPSQLKDGKPHSISARVMGSTYQLKWGPQTLTCPAEGRLATEATEQKNSFDAMLLGNPVMNDEVLVEIRGAHGQAVMLLLIDLEGRVVAQTQVKVMDYIERHRLSLGTKPAGVLLLRVSSPAYSKTLKVVSK